jgi:hypothetical protein
MPILPVPGGGGATLPSSYYNSPTPNHGEYQFIALSEIITNFQATYVGDGKILESVLTADITFHAYRALQELSYDTFKSIKSQEIIVPATLQMILPHDYVNYTKISWVDFSGIKHILYPASKTSNPKKINQDPNGDYQMIGSDLSVASQSTSWTSYKAGGTSEVKDDKYWTFEDSRYGLDPQYAQANGSFYIDEQSGKIHFSSNISGKTVILDYISDGVGTLDEAIVHKFAEEAMYKWIAHGCAAARKDSPEYLIARLKKERFAETRKAKIRLSNIKIEEISQIVRGMSKWIKH